MILLLLRHVRIQLWCELGNEKHPPFALATTELVLDIIHSITRSRLAFAVLGVDELLPKDLVVLLAAGVGNLDLLFIVADLEDDVLQLVISLAHAQSVSELRDAVIGDCDTVFIC